jgi:amidase
MELWRMSAVGLARLLRDRQVSSREVTGAILDRIDAVNPRLNAMVTLAPERALADAARLDAMTARGEFAGPLHGLPIGIKDLAETDGIATSYGSPVYASYVPDFDAPHVALLKQAGAVVVGKTNTPEFGAGSQTFNAVFGTTRNPWDPRLTPGGSSGGAAAAVASGMLPFADGSDLAASVRNPASFCGLTGLRPTPGLVPGDVLDPLAVVGPLARSAEDAALLLAGLCSTDAGLPLARPDRPSDFLRLEPCSLRGLRVAWTPDLGDLPVEPLVTRVLSDFRGVLEAAGCLVVDDAPGLSDADEVFQVLRAAMMAGMAPLVDSVKETLAWNIRKGLALTGDVIATARAAQEKIFARMKSFLGQYDVLALPTVQVLPFPVEQEWVTAINGVPQDTYIDWMRSCSRITVTLHPAISVPVGLTGSGSGLVGSGLTGSGSGLAGSGLAGSGLAGSGLPVGLQLVGPYGSDRRLLQIAAALAELAPPQFPW